MNDILKEIKIGFMIAQFIYGMILLALLACQHKNSPQQTANNNHGNPANTRDSLSQDTLFISNWYVKGCAERAAGGDNKSAPPEGDLPGLIYPLDNYLRSAGDSILYNRYEEHLCCRQVKVSIQRRGNTIDIIEYWFRQGCKCKCSSMVHATVYDLPKGEYRVYAIATGTNPFDDKPVNARDTVMDQKIILR